MITEVQISEYIAKKSEEEVRILLVLSIADILYNCDIESLNDLDEYFSGEATNSLKILRKREEGDSQE